jgi:hypothetical protein
MRLLLTVMVLVFAYALPLQAAEWKSFGNGRFGYTIDVPPAFVIQPAPGNGDGGTFIAGNGDRLLVFGTYTIIDTTFIDEVSDRITQAKEDGWQISYSSIEPEWASYSGSKGDRILYVRGIRLCEDGAGFMMLEYRRQALKAYDATIQRMVKSFKTVTCPR